MSSQHNVLGDILARIAEWLGLKPSEAKRVDLVEAKLRNAVRLQTDRMEGLKQEIKKLEHQALHKKTEMEETKSPGTKRIIVGEIERLFKALDRLHGREQIVTSGLDKLTLALAKVEELRAARTEGAEAAALDDIGLDLETAVDELKQADIAAGDLERVSYESPDTGRVNVAERMAEAAGETAATARLSAETERRLKELETA
jgi:hypothetical protein